MATAVVMPKQGNSVESCIIVSWKKHAGDIVAVDDVLCEVETDKATMDVPSPVAGTLLATFFKEGDDVPVMTTIAAVGAAGEDAGALAPAGATTSATPAPAAGPAPSPAPSITPPSAPAAVAAVPVSSDEPVGVSPRARHLAERKGIDPATLAGTGPGGRVIERDVQAAVAAQPKLTPVAKAMMAEGGYSVPGQGSGPGGRVTSKDLVKSEAASQAPAAASTVQPAAVPTVAPEDVEIIPVKGVRKVIADRMLQSLQTTAQLTELQTQRASLSQELGLEDPRQGAADLLVRLLESDWKEQQANVEKSWPTRRNCSSVSALFCPSCHWKTTGETR